MTEAQRQDRIISEVLKLLPELGRNLVDTVTRDLEPQTVSPAQVKVLIHLAEAGPLTMGRLAEGLNITTPSATGLVNPLAEAGLVERERDAGDRRVVNVRLSPEAKQMADRILKLRRKSIAQAFEGMDLDAQEHVLEGLQRLSATLIAGNGGSRGGVTQS